MYNKDKYNRIREGDIFSDIEYIEDGFLTDDGRIGIATLVFPYVVVLSQDCDLESDVIARNKQNQPNKQEEVSTDSAIESILICPAYDKLLFMSGKHLEGMDLKSMKSWGASNTSWKILIKNKDPRYHFLPSDDKLEINDMVIDFKHFYTIPRLKLYQGYDAHFVGTICKLYRELLSQRFANFLSRIGLPE